MRMLAGIKPRAAHRRCSKVFTRPPEQHEDAALTVQAVSTRIIKLIEVLTSVCRRDLDMLSTNG